MLLALVGLLLTVIWLLGVVWYVAEAIGFDNLFLFLPGELGQFVTGFVLPLALLWLVLGYLHLGQRLRRLEEALWEMAAVRFGRPGDGRAGRAGGGSPAADEGGWLDVEEGGPAVQGGMSAAPSPASTVAQGIRSLRPSAFGASPSGSPSRSWPERASRAQPAAQSATQSAAPATASEPPRRPGLATEIFASRMRDRLAEDRAARDGLSPAGAPSPLSARPATPPRSSTAARPAAQKPAVRPPMPKPTKREFTPPPSPALHAPSLRSAAPPPPAMPIAVAPAAAEAPPPAAPPPAAEAAPLPAPAALNPEALPAPAVEQPKQESPAALATDPAEPASAPAADAAAPDADASPLPPGESAESAPGQEAAEPPAEPQSAAAPPAPAATPATPAAPAASPAKPIGFRHLVRITSMELNNIAMDLSGLLCRDADHAQALKGYDKGEKDVFFELLNAQLAKQKPAEALKRLQGAGGDQLLVNYLRKFDALVGESKGVDRSGALAKSLEAMPIGRLHTRLQALQTQTW